MDVPVIAGHRCAVCGASVDVATPMPWRCPAAGDGRHHLLDLVTSLAPLRAGDDPNPFVAFGPYLAWWAFARSNGMTEAACAALTRETDEAIAAVDGTGFRWTPFARADALSDALGFAPDGGVWVKDETSNVSGSHKGRHLLTILLHLRAVEVLGVAPWATPADRPPLAIASCGNAALAAATLAAAVAWPLRVFVPPAADPVVLDRLAALGSAIEPCPRSAGGPAGDPCVHRFRDAVDRGAIPFSVQGTENALCLDGGRTIGWELAIQFERLAPGPPLDRLFVQVGGGALATCTARGVGDRGVVARLHAVQTAGCAPLARAWERARAFGVSSAAAHWDDCMWPWEGEPVSAATGILDDETYDWLGVVRAMAGSGGSPVVVPEEAVLAANAMAREHAAIDVDHTGSAGLAGVVARRAEIADDERVAVIFSGRRRTGGADDGADDGAEGAAERVAEGAA